MLRETDRLLEEFSDRVEVLKVEIPVMEAVLVLDELFAVVFVPMARATKPWCLEGRSLFDDPPAARTCIDPSTIGRCAVPPLVGDIILAPSPK